MDNFLKDIKTIEASAATAAGTGQVNSGIVDTAGFDGVCFIVHLGVVTSGSVMNAAIQDSGDNASTNMANCTPSAGIVNLTDAGASSNSLIIVDTVCQQKRYCRLILNRATQNAAVSCITAHLYRTKNPLPVTADTSVAASALSVATS